MSTHVETLLAHPSDSPHGNPSRPRTGAWLLGLLLMLAAVAGGAQELRFLEAEFDGAGGVDGLDNAHAAVVSPDGLHVYVAADQDDAVAVFARDGASGELTFVEARFDGAGGVDGLDGAEALALSPGGEHLYVVGLLDAAVAVFARDGASGALTFVEVHKDSSQGGSINGLAGASGVAVSPDGLNVYVAGRFDDAVVAFTRNPANGRLTYVETEFDGNGGVDGLADVTAVAVSPDDEHVYAAGLGDQSVAIFSRGMNGALDFVAAAADTLPDAEIDIDDHHGLAFDPTGSHLYVTNHVEDPADGWIATFFRDAASGLLTAVSPVLLGTAVDFCFLGIEGDSGLAVSPNGTRAWANLTWDAALVMFERDPTTGRLTVLDGLCDETLGMGSPPGQVDGLWGVQGVAVSPDGAHIYAASGNLEDAVAAFGTDEIFTDGFESGDTSAWSSTG